MNILLSFLFYLGLILLVIASLVDIKKQQVDWKLLTFSVLTCLVFGYLKFGFRELALSLLASGSIPLLLVVLSREKWMGLGDVFFAVMVAGLSGYPSSLIALLTAFIAGSLFGIICLKVDPKIKTLPFGPFLAFGCLIAIIFGSKLLTYFSAIY